MSIKSILKRIFHRHHWHCTDEPIFPSSSENHYWHVDKCCEDETRVQSLNGVCRGRTNGKANNE